MERIYRMHDLINASRARGECPVTFICGPCDAGKSTISKILLSKDVAAGYTPIFVDLDCGQNSISLPGAISAVVIDRPSSVTEGLTIPEKIISYEVGDISFPAHVISFVTQLTYKLSRTLYSLISKDDKRKKKANKSLYFHLYLFFSAKIWDIHKYVRIRHR